MTLSGVDRDLAKWLMTPATQAALAPCDDVVRGTGRPGAPERAMVAMMLLREQTRLPFTVLAAMVADSRELQGAVGTSRPISAWACYRFASTWERPSPRATVCPAGHIFDKANTYISPKGDRRCRACRRDAWHEKYAAPHIRHAERGAVRWEYGSPRPPAVTLLTLACETCGAEFQYLRGGKRAVPKYCSVECRPSTPKFVRACRFCGREFRSTTQSSKAQWCATDECRARRREEGLQWQQKEDAARRQRIENRLLARRVLRERREALTLELRQERLLARRYERAYYEAGCALFRAHDYQEWRSGKRAYEERLARHREWGRAARDALQRARRERAERAAAEARELRQASRARARLRHQRTMERRARIDQERETWARLRGIANPTLSWAHEYAALEPSQQVEAEIELLVEAQKRDDERVWDKEGATLLEDWWWSNASTH